MNSTAALLHWGAAVPMWYQSLVAFFAVQFPYILIGIAALVILIVNWKNKTRLAWHLGELAIAALVARFFIDLIRIFIQTTRPNFALNFVPLIDPINELSFPSTHAALLSAVAFTAWRERTDIGVGLLVSAIVVGLARVFAGVHWPVDIVGGLIVGAVSAVLVHYVSLHISKKNS